MAPRAPAATPAPPGEGEEPVAEVRVVGSSSRSLERVPGATTVVTERELQRTQPMTANEALRRVPGVYARDEEGMGLRPNISVRGLDPTRSRRVLLLEDGIPISLAPYSEPEMYYNPPIDRMGRLEVVRGSGGILFGPQTIGGVINYVTPAIPAGPTWTVRGAVGDRGLLLGQVTAGNRIGGAGFLVSALRRQGDGFRGMNFEVTDLFGKVSLRTSARSELLLRLGLYNEGSLSTYLGLTESMFQRDPTQNPVPYEFFRVRRYSVGLIHTWRPSEAWQLQTLVYAYATQRDWDRQRYDREPVPGLLYERIVGDQGTRRGAIYLRDASLSNDRGYEVWGVEPRLRGRLRTAGLRHELDLGARVLGESAALQVLLGDGATARAGALASDEVRRGTAFAAYLQDRLHLSERVQLTPGVRLESYFFTRTIRRDAGVDVFREGSGRSVDVIPGVSLAWSSPRLTLFGGMHVGYAPPRIAAAITATGRDRGLDAERSLNYEAGARWTEGSWLRAEATAFLLDFQNEIVTVSGQESEFENGGRSLHTGVEASAQVELGRLLRAPTNVLLGARYTLVDARFRGGEFHGRMVPYAVPHTLALTAGVEHPSGWSAQATWFFASAHFSDRENSTVGSADGLFGPIPAYHTLDLAARYTHRRSGLGVSLTVKNLQGYFTDQGRPRVYIASRSPEGIFPGGFGQVLLGLRWDR
ncbi:MAG: TonB-dependent receptor [Deltaproteobacteria bacterium]|nr:TonB-dependent receptor [Deltaproteobacteria bacterium]